MPWMPWNFSFGPYIATTFALSAVACGMFNPDGWGVFSKLSAKIMLGWRGEADLYGEFIVWIVHLVQHERIHLLAYCNLVSCLTVIIFYAVAYVFLGELRIIEDHSLRERTMNYLLFKVIFLGAVVEPELLELLCWCGCFTVLGVIKMLGSLGRDRFEFIAVSHNTTVMDHVRLTTLLCLVFASCAFWAQQVWSIFYDGAGPSVVLLLLFECATCIISMIQTLSRYLVHAINVHAYQGEWSWRGPLWYLIGFVGDTTALLISAAHYVHVWTINGISLNLVDAILFLNIRVTIGNMVKNINGWLNYRHMMRQLDTAWPDATTAELEAIDENCGICLRHMHEAKRLPCNHYFHRACLQRLMEGGGRPACPMCRAPLFPEHMRRGGAAGASGGGGGNGGNNVRAGVGAPSINLQLGINLGSNRRRFRPPVPRDPRAHEVAVRALFPDQPALLTSVSGPDLIQGQRLVGHEIRKRFGLRYYGGRVVRVWEALPGVNGRHVDQRTVMYRIDYEDGDREDMIWNELSRLLVGITVSSTGASLVAGGGPAPVNPGGGNRDGIRNAAIAGSRGVHTGNVICARISDWTGSSPSLYRFAGASPIREIAKTYASERGLDLKSVTFHVYDAQRKAPIKATLHNTLEETVRKHGCLNPKGGAPANECRIFAKLEHFPDYIEGGSTRFIAPRDFARLQRRRRRRARMAANA